MSCCAILCLPGLFHAVLCSAVPPHAVMSHAMPRSFPVLCCAMLGPSHAMPCYAVSCSNEPHCTILCLPGLFHAMLCHVKLCSVLPCHTVPCHVPPSPNANSPLQAVLPTMVPVPSAPCCPLDGVPLSLSWGQAGVPVVSTHCSQQDPNVPPHTALLWHSRHPPLPTLGTDGRRRLWDTISCCYR